jgi:hypothetical protein
MGICGDGVGGMITAGASLTDASVILEGTLAAGTQDFLSTVRSSGLLGTVSNVSVGRDADGKYVVAWEDRRGSGSPGQDLTQIYAQLTDRTQTMFWTTGGELIAGEVHKQGWPVVLIPGSAAPSQTNIVAWLDARDGANPRLYYQALRATDGAGLLTANGTQIASATSDSATNMNRPMIITDGANAFFTAWANAGGDIYAQKLDETGVALWGSGGLLVCSATGTQNHPRLCLDGSGGVIIAWEDARGAATDIYAQRVTSAGAVSWAANGVVICNATNAQGNPDIVSDNSGGAIIAWDDARGSDKDIYAQRVNGSGVVQWTANGVVICNATTDQNQPRIVTDGSGGAIVCWRDKRTASRELLYAQRVNGSGTVQWTANGVLITTGGGLGDDPTNIYGYTAAPSGSGGIVAMWYMIATSGYDSGLAKFSSSGTLVWEFSGQDNNASPTTGEPPGLGVDSSGNVFVAYVRTATNRVAVVKYLSALGGFGGSGFANSSSQTGVGGVTLVVAADGTMMVAWHASTDKAIFVQKYSNAMSAQWATNGVTVADVASSNQTEPMAVA